MFITQIIHNVVLSVWFKIRARLFAWNSNHLSAMIAILALAPSLSFRIMLSAFLVLVTFAMEDKRIELEFPIREGAHFLNAASAADTLIGLALNKDITPEERETIKGYIIKRLSDGEQE